MKTVVFHVAATSNHEATHQIVELLVEAYNKIKSISVYFLLYTVSKE